VDPKTFEFGQSKSLLHATFGLPNGYNAQPTTQYLRAHEKEPVLPKRKSSRVGIFMLGATCMLRCTSLFTY
jgi:hypothetical protein